MEPDQLRPRPQSFGGEAAPVYDPHLTEVHTTPRIDLVHDLRRSSTGVQLELVLHPRVSKPLVIEVSEQVSLVGQDLTVQEGRTRFDLHFFSQRGRVQLSSGDLQGDIRHHPLWAAVDLEVNVQPPLAIQLKTSAHDVDVHVPLSPVEVLQLVQVRAEEAS